MAGGKMGLCIIGEKANRLLDLLWRIDDGYILTEEERQHLKDISSVQSLQLGVEKLPDSIGELSQVKELNIFNSQLVSLPESIGKLSQLKKLDVFSNQLTSLPDSMNCSPSSRQ